MKRFLKIAVLAAFSVCPLHAQISEQFEAAIVRPSGPKSTFQSTFKGSEFIATQTTLRNLIAMSYPDLQLDRISGGPSWVNSALWDLRAKLPAGTPSDREPMFRATEQMLRTFLADEFRLKTHFVRKEETGYELIVNKGGPKLNPSEAGEFSVRYTGRGIQIHHGTMQELATYLACRTCPRLAADCPVTDKTGLSGYYDVTLNWARPDASPDGADDSLPSVFAALEEQLGLKLQPGKAAVDYLVIDAVERPPEN